MAKTEVPSTAVTTFMETHRRLADLMQLAVEMEHSATVTRIRMEVLRKLQGTDTSVIEAILDAEGER